MPFLRRPRTACKAASASMAFRSHAKSGRCASVAQTQMKDGATENQTSADIDPSSRPSDRTSGPRYPHDAWRTMRNHRIIQRLCAQLSETSIPFLPCTVVQIVPTIVKAQAHLHDRASVRKFRRPLKCRADGCGTRRMARSGSPFFHCRAKQSARALPALCHLVEITANTHPAPRNELRSTNSPAGQWPSPSQHSAVRDGSSEGIFG
jgi:hypothetical protein